jgi:hypothetical protein
MSYTSTLQNISINTQIRGTLIGTDPGSQAVASSQVLDLPSQPVIALGTGPGSATWLYSNTMTLAGGAAGSIDLSNTSVFTDPLKNPIVPVAVTGFDFSVTSGTGGQVMIGTGSDPILGPSDHFTLDVQIAPAPNSNVMQQRQSTGWVFNSSTAKLLNVTNTSSGSVTVAITMFGR